MNQRILESDEMALKKPEAGMSAEALLRQEGVFFLKDVVRILNIDLAQIRKQAARLTADGANPWRVMGVRKVWNHWVVRMKVFAPDYRKTQKRKWQKVPNGWDGNRLMAETGVFKLSEVTKLLPMNTHQIRHQAKVNPGAKDIMGVWKDEEAGIFLVDMSIFGPWFAKLWSNPDKMS